jgi:valyl-tRNA synthetase
LAPLTCFSWHYNETALRNDRVSDKCAAQNPTRRFLASGIDYNRAVVGPAFRKDTGAFMEAVKVLPAEELAHPLKTIKVNGKDLDVPENAFAPKYSYVEEGAKVDVITVGDVIVTVAGKE